MAFRGSGPLLFALLAVVFILEAYAADYETFLRQHYDNPKSSVKGTYCDVMMQRRGMTKPQCKALNSFVHGTKNQINDVCGAGGEPYGNGLRRSRKQFSVTSCRHKGGKRCEYRENKSQRYIVIACANGKPIHYDEDFNCPLCFQHLFAERMRGSGLRRSRKRFSVTTCRRPPCNYRDNKSQRFIAITCVNGKPDQYEEGQS